MFLPRPLLIALQFLTTLPIRIQGEPDADATGRSLSYYPLVGLMIGTLLAAGAWMLDAANPLVAAALLLTLWVVITGALHLDGLADSADAWLGGLGDRERTLAIMKDPYCGPAAVVTLILVLLLKFTALTCLIAKGQLASIAVAPVLGRATPILLLLTTPYVRPRGLGSLLADNLIRRASGVSLLATLVAIALLIGTGSLWLLLSALGGFLILRKLMLQRLGGTTGDTAGALVEITETAVLLAALLPD